MAPLSQLPDEMTAEIWGHILEPRDVESFALASEYVYAIGKPFVEEHNKLKREYTLFETGPNTRASAPAVLLKEVLLRPRVTLFVTHLLIGRHQIGWRDLSGGRDDDILYSMEWPMIRHAPYPDDDMALFTKAIMETSFVPRNDVERSIKRVRAGDEDPILPLLCLVLPNLTMITLNKETQSVAQFPKTIQCIAKAENITLLTRLKTVTLISSIIAWTWSG